MSANLQPRVYSVSKSGNEPRENEDAVFVNHAGDCFSIAVADGATLGICSSLWARLLVRGHTGLVFPGSASPDALVALLEEWLSPLRSRWLKTSRKLLGTKLERWYVHNAIVDGAYSTLAILRLHISAESIRWTAFAIGDTCVAIVTNNAVSRIFPLDASSQFGHRPSLIPSRMIGAYALSSHVRFFQGELTVGTTVMLMTDALAKWFIESTEKGLLPWRQLEHVHSSDDYALFVDRVRQSGELTDDDTTLVVVEL